MINQKEQRYIFIDKWPRHKYYAGDQVTLKLYKSPNKELVITKTDIELGRATETTNEVIYHFVMPDRDVNIESEYRTIYLSCPSCGHEYEKGKHTCPNCQTELHAYAGEIKSCHDFIGDGVLAYGVDVGRIVFEKYGKVVYVLTDLPHIGASDVLICYQISREVYDSLLAMSQPHRIPDPPVSAMITNKYQDRFLCSESAYAKRAKFTLQDVDLSLCDDVDTVANNPNDD